LAPVHCLPSRFRAPPAQEFRQSITSHRLHISSVRSKLAGDFPRSIKASFVSDNINGVPLAQANRCGLFWMSNCLSDGGQRVFGAVLLSEEDYTAMLSDVQWKPNRRVSRAKATTAAVFYALSIPSVCALPTSIANAHTTSSGESPGPLHQRVSAKPQKGVIVGRASWYGQAAAGHKTATGERLDPNKLTAATTELPLKASALVTNLNNGRSGPVRINDCGPYAKGRDIDVSRQAAEKLAMAHSGTAPVAIKLIAAPPDASYCSRPRPARRRVQHIRFRRF
jgi:rare lipoprotein A